MGKIRNTKLRQQNLHHDYNAIIWCITEAIKNETDVLLIQDPYVYKLGDKFIPAISTARHLLVADQSIAFQSCIVLLNTNIDTLKINQCCDQL